jgi:hypothetical protein
MTTQNMSEKIARSVRSNSRIGPIMLVLHDQRPESFNVPNKSVSHPGRQYPVGKLTASSALDQWLTHEFAVYTLSHIQQTQCNTRQPMAYSFSGAIKL